MVAFLSASLLSSVYRACAALALSLSFSPSLCPGCLLPAEFRSVCRLEIFSHVYRSRAALFSFLPLAHSTSLLSVPVSLSASFALQPSYAIPPRTSCSTVSAILRVVQLSPAWLCRRSSPLHPPLLPRFDTGPAVEPCIPPSNPSIAHLAWEAHDELLCSLPLPCLYDCQSGALSRARTLPGIPVTSSPSSSSAAMMGCSKLAARTGSNHGRTKLAPGRTGVAPLWANGRPHNKSESHAVNAHRQYNIADGE
jgi:hypothetical protein